MLLKVKFQLFVFFCVIFAPFLPLNFVFSTSAPKVNPLSLPSAIMKLNEKMDDVRSRVDQLESNGNNTFDVQEMMTHITRAISDSNGQIMKQFEEKLEKTIENIEQNILKKMEKFDEKLDKMEESILFHLLNGTERGSDESDVGRVWSGVTSQCESMCRAKLTTWANHTASQLRTKLTEMELCDSNQPKAVVINKCEPSPCLHGGKCLPTSTGTDYVCVCLKFSSGIHCQNVECTANNRCWRLNDTLYTVIESNLNWTEAKVKCEDHNMTLAMPKDEERTLFLYDQLELAFGFKSNLWLGLKYDVSGSGWFWVDGSALGEYTAGNPYVKSWIGSYFGVLYLLGGSQLWWKGDAASEWYPLCEFRLSSHSINRCLLTTQPQTTTQPPTTTTTGPITVCHPNPCLHGGRCLPNSTGSDYVCVDCPKFTSGIHCENVECTLEKKCWRLNDTLYTVIETELTWAEAKVKCENLNMTLAMPKDQETNQFLYNRLKPIYATYPYSPLWIGLKYDVEKRGWFWVDGNRLGEYFGGRTDLKSYTGSGVLFLYGYMEMLWWSDANDQWYAVCEAKLISH